MNKITQTTINGFKTNEEIRETIATLEAKIQTAHAQGHEWVETSEENIKYYNPHGLGKDPLTGKPQRYFNLRGVKVCAFGDAEKIEKDHLDYNKDISIITHGEGGVLVGRT